LLSLNIRLIASDVATQSGIQKMFSFLKRLKGNDSNFRQEIEVHIIEGFDAIDETYIPAGSILIGNLSRNGNAYICQLNKHPGCYLEIKEKTDAGFAEKGKKLETAFFAVATSFYWWAHAHHPSTLTPVLAKTLSILFDKCPH